MIGLSCYPPVVNPLQRYNSGMQMLGNRRILLGLTGSIAAYKAVSLARMLVLSGADVQVVMTGAAKRFVGSMTMAAMTGNAVRDDLWDVNAELAMGHIELARWAELIVIAPASADIIARLASGNADDLLSTICLASNAPLMLAPAMNHVMWKHPATSANVELLTSRGATLVGPETGALAERESGAGRMAEPQVIERAVIDLIAVTRGPAEKPTPLAGRNVLITAGPTIEPIDPVRFITNHSSGRMGYAMATACAAAGACVTLVSGPTSLPTPNGVNRKNVQSAVEMYSVVMRHIGDVDIFVGAAAVADYTPAEPSSHKIKKDESDESLRLVRTPDIIAEVARAYPGVVTLGFAAETRDVAQAARAKRRNKGLTLIAGNRVGPDHAFGRDDNTLLVIAAETEITLGPASKNELADSLVIMLADALGQ